MRGCLPRAIVSLSIDVDGALPRHGETIARCAELLHKHELPATWAMTEPFGSQAERLARESVGHEIAILGDGSWIGHAAGRGRFSQKLADRLERALATGIQVTSLVVVRGTVGDQAELAAKLGITAVRQALSDHKPGSGNPIRGMLGGLWQFAPALTLPGASRWLLGGGGRGQARAAIDSAAAQRLGIHLAVDAGRLAERGSGALRLLDGVLRYISGRRSQGMLEAMTMRHAAVRLAGQYRAEPSRSILRSAA